MLLIPLVARAYRYAIRRIAADLPHTLLLRCFSTVPCRARLEKRAVEGFISDKNREVIQERVEKDWAELERRKIDVIKLPDGEYGYISNRASIDKRIKKWKKMIERLHANKPRGNNVDV